MKKHTGFALAVAFVVFGHSGLTYSQVAPPGAPPMAPQALHAPNLGILYTPIPYNNGTFGLRLTRPPLPASPASQLPLKAGDVIFALDGQRITHPNDVANHFDQTTVDFVDAGTNTLRRGTITLPSADPDSQTFPHPKSGMTSMASNRIGQQGEAANGGPVSAPGGPLPLVARNLGVLYVAINHNDGTLGLRLTRPPLPGSPASQLPLEAGDIIFALDGQRITHPNDVANHFDQTTVEFFHPATNSVHQGSINLPSQGGPTPWIPHGAAGGQMTNMARNRIGRQPLNDGEVGAPMTSMASNRLGQPNVSNNGREAGPDSGGLASAAGNLAPRVARNLGIVYVPIRFPDGAIGLRLTRAPLPGSPASQLPLDAGDIIVALDGQRLMNPNDVANHFDQTTVDYVDSGTNTQQSGSITLPSQNP